MNIKVSTLQKIASAFDCAFDIRFMSFDKYLKNWNEETIQELIAEEIDNPSVKENINKWVEGEFDEVLEIIEYVKGLSKDLYNGSLLNPVGLPPESLVQLTRSTVDRSSQIIDACDELILALRKMS